MATDYVMYGVTPTSAYFRPKTAFPNFRSVGFGSELPAVMRSQNNIVLQRSYELPWRPSTYRYGGDGPRLGAQEQGFPQMRLTSRQSASASLKLQPLLMNTRQVISFSRRNFSLFSPNLGESLFQLSNRCIMFHSFCGSCPLQSITCKMHMLIIHNQTSLNPDATNFTFHSSVGTGRYRHMFRIYVCNIHVRFMYSKT